MPDEPVGTRDRLRQAALQLFAERGFDGTTAADIAATAGVTERTFFRHFSDKREALFTPQSEFDALFLTGLESQDGDDPSTLLRAALLSAALAFPLGRRPWSRDRSVVLEADTRFQERELFKLSRAATALSGALVERGVDPTRAAVEAETATVVFRVAFARWLERADGRTLGEEIQQVLSLVDQQT